VAYQTAYMKANYPVEYMAALLTADAGDTEKIAILAAECERLSIPVLPPDVNESRATFTIVDGGTKIRFGLSSIKNFGEGIARSIMEERERGGPFSSLSDFLCRVGSRNNEDGANSPISPSLNKKSLESLIKCGALDALGERAHLLLHIETLLSFHRDATAPSKQDSLFGATAAPVLSLPALGETTSLTHKLAWEKELLGVYVSGHPLDAYAATAAKAGTTISGILEKPVVGMTVILPVLITETRTVLTKSGEKMAFLNLEDRTGSIEAVAFPKLFKEHASHIASGACVLVKANVASRNGELSLALDNLKPLS
jgi:DNA polymerase III subunit alpha